MTTQSSLIQAVRRLRDQAGDRTSDVEVLRRYAHDRDESAFTELVRRYGRLVFGVARRQLSDVHHVEDVFQATFLALARKADRLDERQSLTNWLYTVSLRLARKAKQRESRRTAFDRSQAPRSSTPRDPLDELSGRELVALIDEEVELLPENYRLPLLLCCWQGLSREEAAKELGWSPGAVKGRLERGRQRLADRLAKKGMSPLVILLDPLTSTVPESLVARAASLASSPWSASIPASIGELVSTSSWTKVVMTMTVCCTLLVAGLATIFVGSEPAPPTSEPQRPKADRIDNVGEFLPKQAVRRFGTSRFRQGLEIRHLAISDDGSFALAVSGTDAYETIRRFDMSDGRRVMTLPQRRYNVDALAISPDGKTFATKQEVSLHLYDAKTGEELLALEVDKASSRGVNHWLTYSPDGSTVALSVLGKTIDFVDLATAKIVRRLPHGRVADGIFTLDGNRFIAGGYEYNDDKHNIIRMWDVTTGKELRQFDNGKRPVSDLALSPDSSTLAAGGDDGHVRLWELASGKQLHKVGDGQPRRWCIEFSPDGKTLAVAGDTLRLYDAVTMKSRLHIPRKATHPHFSPSGKVLTAAVGGSIHRWNAATGQQLTPSGSDGSLEQIRLGMNGRLLITHDHLGVVHWADPMPGVDLLGFSPMTYRVVPPKSSINVWDRKTGEQLQKMDVHFQGEIAVSPNGKFLVLSEVDSSMKYTPTILRGGKISLYDLTTRKVVRTLPKFSGGPQFKCFSQDGKTLITLDRLDGEVRVWDVHATKRRRLFSSIPAGLSKPDHGIAHCRLSPDDRTLAVVYQHPYPRNDRKPIVWLWDVTTGKLLHSLEGHSHSVRQLAFSPDGQFLVSCEERLEAQPERTDSILVWNVAEGKRLAALPHGLPGEANGIAFSPDGRIFATSSFDGRVAIWEVATWTRRTTFQAHADHVIALHFGDDGTLFTGSTDATVVEWRLRPETQNDMTLSLAWSTLLDKDAEKAYRAQAAFLVSPTKTMAFLSKHLEPVGDVDPKRLAELLVDLDSEEFDKRERASQELAEYGRHIEATLRKALAKTPSDEVRRRISKLLSEFAVGVIPPPELRAIRAVEILEWLGTTSAQALLSELAEGEFNDRLTREARVSLRRLGAVHK